MACTSGETDSSGEANSSTTISALHPDVIQTHILTRLDGPSLASAAATCSQLHALSSHDHLWANVTHSTWPSTDTPRVTKIISTFPDGYRSFFSDSFPSATDEKRRSNPDRTYELISAVDLFHRQTVLLSKVVETETVTQWFLWSPFMLNLLQTKEKVQTAIDYPSGDDECVRIGEEMRLSWIVIEPNGRRAVNVSSRRPVSVARHWLTGETEVLFVTVIGEAAMCRMKVRCGGAAGGGMQVREVSMETEDLDGKRMNGRDSLGMLQRALEGKRGKLRNEGRDEYEEFLKRKVERKERKARIEMSLFCVVVATVSFLGLSCFCLFF